MSLSVMTHSCTKVFYNIYGVEILKEFSTDNYNDTLHNLENVYGDEVNSIISSDSLYREFIKVAENVGKKNLSQPVQMIYFDGDAIVSYWANCYAPGRIGSRTLNWNHNGGFDAFPPVSAIEITSDFPTLRDFERVYGIQESPNRYTIIFIWSTMLRKQSVEAFKTVVQNIENKEYTSVYLVNIDHFHVSFND